MKLTIVETINQTCIAATILLAMATSGNAQIINYGAPQNITGDSNVINSGVNYAAFAFGDGNPGDTSTGPLVNGIQFTNLAADGGGALTVGNLTLAPVGDSLHAYFGYAGSSTGLSSSYATLLDGGLTNYGLQNNKAPGNYGDQLTFNGLTLGDVYQVELFSNASSGKQFGGQPTDDTTIVNSGASTTYATLEAQGGTNNLGQYITGTFTATSSTASIYLLSAGRNNGNDSLVLNAAVLNDVTGVAAVPEPSTVSSAVLGLGVLVLMYRIRRRRTV